MASSDWRGGGGGGDANTPPLKGKVAKFGGHSLDGCKVNQLFREGDSKSPFPGLNFCLSDKRLQQRPLIRIIHLFSFFKKKLEKFENNAKKRKKFSKAD